MTDFYTLLMAPKPPGEARGLTLGKLIRYLLSRPRVFEVQCLALRLGAHLFERGDADLSMKGIHFISYGDDRFRISRRRIRYEALRFGFRNVTVYRPETLPENFRLEFRDILKMPRLGGYAAWKFYILRESLLRLNDDEILVYCDAGCMINPGGRKRFFEYIDMVRAHPSGMLSFGFDEHLSDKCWTIRELYEITGSKVDDTGQLITGVIILRKCPTVMKMIDEAYLILRQDPLLITDHYNANQAPYFIENRHDQSLLSLLRKKYGSLVLLDETYIDGGEWNKLKHLPFWATRLKV